MEYSAHWPITWHTYLEALPDTARGRLVELLKLVEASFPDATLDWAYQMPAFKYKGKPLVYAAGYAKHTGVYALPNTHAAFAEALKPYKQGKGSVQFPHHQPLPLVLIRDMVLERQRAINEAG
jgi:uncharacterized protein YdhG (YjbR/CyaY superfamily)